MRSVRRHHRQRLLFSRKNYHQYWNNWKELNPRIVDTPCPCSCWMCGNTRKAYNDQYQRWAQLSMQEKRFCEYADYEEN